MLIEESRRRQAELENIILEMAMKPLEDNDLRKIAIKFKELYTCNFRHNYSGFYPLILDVSKDENEYNLEFLSVNIEQLRILVETDYVNGEKEFKGLYMPLSKLSDHLNLEIARYNHYSQSEIETRNLVKKNQELQKTLSDAQEALKDTKESREFANRIHNHSWHFCSNYSCVYWYHNIFKFSPREYTPIFNL